MVMANSHHSKEKYIQIANKLRGQKRTEEQKKKISDSLLGHKHSPETLAKMRKPRSEQAKLNISKAMIGKTPWNKGKTGIYSEETISKIRNANLGKVTSVEVKKKLRDSLINFFKSKDSSYVPPSYEEGEIFRKHSQLRADRMNRNGGHHSKYQWEHLKKAFDNRCAICNRQEPEIKITKDHIISIKNGGSNDIKNIQPLCRSCNSRKR